MAFKPIRPESELIDTFFRTHNLHVPEFQRRYDWRVSEHVARLWEDLSEYVLTIQGVPAKQAQHFFGASILFNDPSDDARAWLIDGQQRTVTLVCLFAAIRDIARTYDPTDRLKTDAGDMIWNSKTNQALLTSGVFKKDDEALDKVSNPETYWKTGYHDPPSALGPSNRILKTYVYFLGAFEELLNGEKVIDHKHRLGLLSTWFEEIRLTTYLHYVETNSLDQAYIMFDSQNSRGMGLDPSDILKVRLLEIARMSTPSQKDNFMDAWSTLSSASDNDPKNISFILTDYYKSRTKNMVNSRGLLSAWQNIIGEVKQGTASEQTEKFKTLLTELTNFAGAWSPWFFKEIKGGVKHDRDYTDLIDMRVSNQYAAMIGALHAGPVSPGVGNASDYQPIQAAILRSMEYVHIHQKLGGSIDSNSLKKLHKEWMHLCYRASSKDDSYSFADAVTEIQSQAALKESELKAFQTNLWYAKLSRSEARYLLRKCESLLTSAEVKADESLELEHICPKSWESTSTIGWEHITWNEHDTRLECLGNLTLLRKSDNIKVSNKRWDDKKPSYETKSTLKINNPAHLTRHKAWDNDSIKARVNILAKGLHDKLTL